MSIIVITGISAAGTSTVAQALAESYPRAVHVRGDLFRRMIVTGREPLGPAPSGAATRQLHLRYALAAQVADEYAEAGFVTVLQDIAIGEHLDVLLGQFRHRPLHLVVLAPSAEVVTQRDEQRRRLRGKVAYGAHLTVAQLDQVLRDQTPRRGLWLDSGAMTVDETVAQIRARLHEALLGVEHADRTRNTEPMSSESPAPRVTVDE